VYRAKTGKPVALASGWRKTTDIEGGGGVEKRTERSCVTIMSDTQIIPSDVGMAFESMCSTCARAMEDDHCVRCMQDAMLNRVTSTVVSPMRTALLVVITVRWGHGHDRSWPLPYLGCVA